MSYFVTNLIDDDEEEEEEQDDSPFDDAYSYLDKESMVKSVGDAMPTIHVEKPNANNQSLLRYTIKISFPNNS